MLLTLNNYVNTREQDLRTIHQAAARFKRHFRRCESCQQANLNVLRPILLQIDPTNFILPAEDDGTADEQEPAAEDHYSLLRDKMLSFLLALGMDSLLEELRKNN